MLRNTLQPKWGAIAVILLGLHVAWSPRCYSQQKDVSGWQSSRWGMTNEDIVRVFGVRLKKLGKSEIFFGMRVDYVIPELQLAGEYFTVYFQISDATDKLSQILIRLNEQRSPVPRGKIFNRLESLLRRQYGKPLDPVDESRTSANGFTFMRLTRVWKFPTSTVVLGYSWDNQIDASLLTIRYFPTK